MEAYICLTYTGTSITPLGPTMRAFSNVDNYTTIIETIPLTSLTGSSCPYLLENIPEGTTIIRLTDPVSLCCIDIPFSDGINLCEICDPIGFSVATNPNIGSISVGNLTGLCDSNPSYFYLDWYGPGTGSTNLIFSSSYGNIPNSSPASNIHPLTGTSQVYLYPGQYRPVIRVMSIDGGLFSYQYGALGDCFQNSPLVVLPYTVTNGSAAPAIYQHCIDLNNNGTQTSTGLVELSGGTNYVPFRLDGGNQADLLRIYFSGASYLTPIPIESIVIGSNVGTSFLNTEFDMTSSNINYKTFGGNGSFTKVLCLTGLTRNPGDVLLFEITPQGTTPTDFTFCFTQLNTFDCEMCALTRDYTNYKIVQSSISATTGTCGSTTVKFNVSGCSTNADVNEDLYKYIYSGSTSASVDDAYGSVEKIVNLTTSGAIGCGTQTYNSIGSIDFGCEFIDMNATPAIFSNTYDFGTQVRTIKFTTKEIPGNPWHDYFDSIVNSFDSTIQGAALAGLWSSSPSQLGYWGSITLHLPKFYAGFRTNPELNRVCYNPILTQAENDANMAYNATVRNNEFQTTFSITNVTAAISINPVDRTLTIAGGGYANSPTPYIPILFPPGPCVDGSCNDPFSNVFSQLGNSIKAGLNITTYNAVNVILITNGFPIESGLAYNANPWSINAISQFGTGAITSASTFNRITMYQYENKTYPLTGVTPGNYGVLIADTATTCPNITNYTFDENSGSTSLNNYVRYNYLYNVNYIDNGDNGKYQITATQISSNGEPTTAPPILIGSGTTAPSFTVIDSTYFI